MSQDKKQSFLEELTMMRLEEACPQELKRFGELRNKSKETPLTLEEGKEKNNMDGKLLENYIRIETHYKINMPFLRKDVKDRLIEEVKKWHEKRETSN